MSTVGSVGSNNLPGGRSLVNLSQAPGSAINTVERIVSAFPQPAKRPGTTAAKMPAKTGDPLTGMKATGSLSISGAPPIKLP